MEALGLNLKWFLFQLGNFVLLFLILNFLLHKPLIKLLDSRKEEVKNSLDAAEKMKKEVAEAEARQKEILSTAQKEAAALVQTASQQAKELEEHLRQEAEEKANRLLENAQKEISQEREQLRDELKADLAKLVILATQKVVDQEIPASEKRDQIRKIVNSLEKPEAA